MEPFYLSQSALKDWKKLCPLVWKAKWIDRNEDLNPEPFEMSPMRWGLIFETMAIGAGLGGKAVFPTPKEKASAIYKRVVEQARLCKEMLKIYGRKVFIQKQLNASFEHNGITVHISGNLDDIHEVRKIPVIIDLKSTGDVESEFGPWQWGDTDKMDTTQAFQYELLYELNFGVRPLFQYWVFDFSVSMKTKFMQVSISDFSREAHKDRLAEAYSQIQANIILDDWQPRPSYKECSKCLVPCSKKVTFPEIINVIR